MKTLTIRFRRSPRLLTWTSLLVAFLLFISTALPTFANAVNSAPPL